ncbi:MAG TPA: LuxR family transcriptional regulator [Rhizomicrobium sp.]
MLSKASFYFIEEIDRHNEPAELVASFQGLIGMLGLTYFMIGEPRPPLPQDGHLWATTWPQEWLYRWLTQNYLRADPIIRKLRVQNRPMRWNSAAPAVADAPGQRILKEASEFRMNAGFAVPAYSREGLVVVSIGTEHYELGKSEELCLHLSTIYFHAKLERLRARNIVPPRQSRLAPRERECLTWVAAGKTDWEISQILKIAEQTVHEYVQNALIKLKATTRAQAVANAIFDKQISA